MEDRGAGGADVLTEKSSFKSNLTLFIPMRKKNVGELRFCAFYKKGCKCVFNVEQGQSWTSLLNKRRSSTRGIKMCKVMQPDLKASKMRNIYWMKSFSFFPLKVDSLLEPDILCTFLINMKTANCANSP